MSINKVTLLGIVGRDPEVRSLNNGNTATGISIATSEKWVDKSTQEKQETTTWHRVVFYGKQAEVIAQYVKKGQKLYVEGKINSKKYTDKQGVEKQITEVIANVFEFCEKPQTGNTQVPQPRQEQKAPGKPVRPAPVENYDDDIPF